MSIDINRQRDELLSATLALRKTFDDEMGGKPHDPNERWNAYVALWGAANLCRHEFPITVIDALDDSERAALRDQGVDMDDWDYMLVCPPEVASETTHDSTVPDSYTLSRLLTGCCSNRWYRVKFRGRDVSLGIAYHA